MDDGINGGPKIEFLIYDKTNDVDLTLKAQAKHVKSLKALVNYLHEQGYKYRLFFKKVKHRKYEYNRAHP